MTTLRNVIDMAGSVARSGMATPGSVRAAVMGPVGAARYRMSLACVVENAYHTAPGKTALIDDDGELTYRQIRTYARSVAHWLHHYRTTNTFDTLRIGVLARNGRGAVIPVAAKGYVGAELYMFNVQSSATQVAATVAENNIQVVFADSEFADRVPDSALLVVVDGDYARPGAYHLNDVVNVDPADVVLPMFPPHGDVVLMSSGTTGTPKGVKRHEFGVPTPIAGVLDATGWKADQTVYMPASLFHMWGYSAIHIIFAGCGTCVTSRVFDPEHGMSLIETHRCDGAISSPIFYKDMLRRDYDMSSLKWIGSAGNAIHPDLVRAVVDRFGPILANFYGSTEISLVTAASGADMAADPTTVGKPSPGTQVVVIDDNDVPVPACTVGHITAMNNTSMHAYTNPNTPSPFVDGRVRTGDMGFIDPRGFLHVVGRSDDMIIVGGENVHPQSVTTCIETLDGVNEAYCVGVDDNEKFQRIAAYVVADSTPAGEALTAEMVRTHVADHIAEHSVPRDVCFIDRLPRNAMGKVVVRDLPDIDA